MADPARARKLADRIREIAAETLERRVKDPRLGFVTVTDARITGDLRDATVFYTVYGDEEERTATAAALESVKGLVRSEVGRRTGVRFTPTLEFVADAIPENAANIDDLLRTARESDERVAQVAAEAEYAGDPDPYRKPADEDEDDADEVDGSDDDGTDEPGDGDDDHRG
ncbi:30S ribosome-binding factor RbfA [Jiangella endophytica]|uniref:30S ribosome-binding factor RbfA n=1 Tax=Jiangella endophytica TaxID=1623398 RepID=UPI000E35763E|nr:30S ribosome-binding factor RbfA [Jiangella endophytica]